MQKKFEFEEQEHYNADADANTAIGKNGVKIYADKKLEIDSVENSIIIEENTETDHSQKGSVKKEFDIDAIDKLRDEIRQKMIKRNKGELDFINNVSKKELIWIYQMKCEKCVQNIILLSQTKIFYSYKKIWKWLR